MTLQWNVKGYFISFFAYTFYISFRNICFPIICLVFYIKKCENIITIFDTILKPVQKCCIYVQCRFFFNIN